MTAIGRPLMDLPGLPSPDREIVRSAHEVIGDAPVIAVSPHLDDAVLSIGGLLAAAGRRSDHATVPHSTGLHIATVFAGDPPVELSPTAAKYHETWNLSGSISAHRRHEDRAAIGLLDGVPVHWPELDAIYRRDGEGWLVDGLPTGHPAVRARPEPNLLAAIANRVRALIRTVHDPARNTAGGTVLAPLAVGGHVDHARTRDAVIAAMADAPPGWQLLLWDDLPYATHYDESPPLPTGTALGEPFGVAVDPDDWIRRKAATDMYVSQLGMMEWEGFTLPQQIDRWATQHGTRSPLETIRQAYPAGWS